MKNKAWNTAEVAAAIDLYFLMVDRVDLQMKYSKAEMIRAIRGEPKPTDNPKVLDPKFRGALQARSRPSVEMKLMNITYCVESIGRLDLSMSDYGYRPLASAQKSLMTAIKEKLI